MKPSAAAVKWFMEENEEIYPCNAVPKTRQGHCPKWLLAMSNNKDGQVWRQMGQQVIRSSCLNHENAQNLIMDGDGIPLPADFAEVVDSLETWGASKQSCWLCKALRVMHEHLKEDNMHGGIAPSRMRLFHDCILVVAQRKAQINFGANSANCNKVLENWNTHFWVRCREECSFFCLAYDSLHCAEGMIDSIQESIVNNGNNANATQHAVRPVNVVPESPSSLQEKSWVPFVLLCPHCE